MSKRKSGQRHKSGRLKQPTTRDGRKAQAQDKGTERFQVRAARFAYFGGEQGKGHEMTCAGRLMLVGAFDGLDHAPETIVAALLEYSNAYWGNFGGGPAVAQLERSDRSQDNSTAATPDPRGAWFAAIDQKLRDAGHQARCAVHDVTVNRHFFPDEDSGWAARIINQRFVQRGLPVAGEMPCDSDFAMLDLLRFGATALVGNRMRKAA